MQRRGITNMVIVLSAAALVGATLLSPRPALAQDAPHCPPGMDAQFVLGIAALKARLGPTMGLPLECEHLNPENGDTIQHTTTGLAYYRPSINTPMFTDGQTHWALSNNQLLMWRSGSVTPPQPTAAESSYLATARPLAQRLDALQARLNYIQQMASAGRLDAVEVAEVGAVYDELTTARDAMRQAPPSDRLASYDRLLVNAFEESVAAAELLLRARLTSIPEARFAFVDEAAARVAVSNRLQGDANQAYSLALPVVVG
jgi:hypothetical protein